MSWEVAASLPVAGQTAWLAVESQHITPDDTVLVSAAAGGVGHLVAQLAAYTGATVIGTASESNHAFLRRLVSCRSRHGPGLIERLRDAAPNGITVALDQHGPQTVETALELGVPVNRINSISRAAEQYGVRHVGRTGLDRHVIAQLTNSRDGCPTHRCDRSHLSRRASYRRVPDGSTKGTSEASSL